ncbi:exopolysaccharide biosynthesis protein, partial [Escherichia coli]|nr:exopolysaccharide biosynthesis protein [Escherichia coli]
VFVRPMLQAIERISRPRWDARRDVIDRLVGLVVFLLAFSAGWPLPLVNVIPGMVVVLIAIAYLQEDGLLLTIAMAAALLC